MPKLCSHWQARPWSGLAMAWTGLGRPGLPLAVAWPSSCLHGASSWNLKLTPKTVKTIISYISKCFVAR
jgi:hypothetical protein